MLSNWGNPDYDVALILTAVTGNVSSPYATHIKEFIQEYSTASGQVTCAPVTVTELAQPAQCQEMDIAPTEMHCGSNGGSVVVEIIVVEIFEVLYLWTEVLGNVSFILFFTCAPQERLSALSS